jgi:xylose isomerase
MAYFPDVPAIKYEGPDSTNPLAFRHYNADEVVDMVGSRIGEFVDACAATSR